MHPYPTVRELHASELNWANDCYSEIDFAHSDDSDFMAIAMFADTKVGLGRIVRITPTIGELGGMFVRPDFRGQSIAAKIVEFLIDHSGYPTLFCIAFAHLEPFYARHGFVPVSSQINIPPAVASKFRWCQEHYSQPVRLMYQTREPSKP